MKSKRRNRILAAVLCLAVLFGCIGAAGAVSAEETFAADPAAWGTQGNNGWYYLYKTQDGSYHELDYYDAASSIDWQKNAYASNPSALGEMIFINQTGCFVGENGSRPVYAFKAPATGTVTLRMQTHSTPEMHMQVYVDNILQKIGGQDFLILNRYGSLPGSMTLTELELSVMKDQMIYVEFYSIKQSVQRQAWINEYSVTYNTVSESVEGMTFAPDASAWGVQPNNGWYYMYKGTNGTYGLLDYYDSTASINWQQNAYAFDPYMMGEMLFINQNSFFTGENGSLPVYMFKAPATGTVRLSFETHGQSDMHVRVLHNRTAVLIDGSDTITFNTNGYTAHTAEIAVRGGDKLYIEGYTTGSNREGWLRNYSVTYLTAEADGESDVYVPDTDVDWGIQDNNGWYYLYQDVLTGEYTELPFIASGTSGEAYTDCFSAHRVFPYCIIDRNSMHPANNANAVKAFCAPVGGSVTFDIDVCRSAPVVPGSPSLLRVMQGNRQIFPADGTAYEITDTAETLSVTTDIARNEWVYIVLSCSGSNANGNVRLSASATYTEQNSAILPATLPAPDYEGFQIRETPTDSAKKDLRFVFSLTTEQFGTLGETDSYRMYELGVVWQKASVLAGRELNEQTGTKVQTGYVDDSVSGQLRYAFNVPALSQSEFDDVYCVRPYSKCTVNGVTHIFYGDTSEACVNDYLASDDLAYGAVTDPVSINLKSGAVTSAQGTLTVAPKYVAKATWHNTRNVYSVSGSADSVKATASGATIDLTATALANGGVSISQTAKASSGGIGGVGLGFTFSMDYDVILPAWGGVRLSREMPDAAPFPVDSPRDCIKYPTEWDAQMFLIQGENGGWLVYQNDDGSQFKNLWLGHSGNNFTFVVETVPQAPYTSYKEFTACPWNIVAYEGDWTVGAALYKQFADEKFGMDEINAAKPDWVNDIQSIVLTDLSAGTMPMLRELAKQTDASKTMLLVPGWRASLYDVNYPDYTPANGLKAYIDEVHSLGFKVMVHANLIGCDDDAPEYTAYGLADDRYLNDLTGNPILESWTTSYSVSFWLINPASPDWQDLLVERLVGIYNTLGVDGIHLDQSLLAYNDGRGYVNGKTSMQGVVELEGKIAKALPNCVFSGEGTNELNCRFSSFLQRAPYGINSATGAEWNDSKISQIVPIDTLLWSGTSRLYHYAAMPTSGSEAAYNAWCRAGMHLGALPTLMRSSAYELLVPNIATQKAVSLIRWYQENLPEINYRRWNGDTEVIAYRTANGQTVEITAEMLW